MTELLRFATAGSVDDGKSTLIGRLLYDSKQIFEDQWDAVERVSRERGEGYTNLALLTDGLRTAQDFKVYYHANSANEHGAYSVDHSGQILVFDPQGRLRLLMKPDLGPEAMAHDMRLLLEESQG